MLTHSPELALPQFPSAAIDALLSGYAPRLRSQKVIVVLQAYIDDSVSDDGVFVLAGYVDTAVNWSAFSHTWHNTLHKQPSIEYFKMSEAASLTGQFDKLNGWTVEKRNKKLSALAAVIENRNMRSMHVAVNGAHYKRTVGTFGPYALQKPYYTCYHTLIYKLAVWHHQSGQNLPLDFIFDEQGSVGLDALIFYQHIVDNFMTPALRKVLGASPIFRSDRQVLPLQAADMLAWHIRRSLEPRFAKEQRPLLKQLFGETHMVVQIPDPVLDRWATEMQAMPGVELVRSKSAWERMKPEMVRRMKLGLGPPVPGEIIPAHSKKFVPKHISMHARLNRALGPYNPSRLLKILRRRLKRRRG